LPKLPQKISGPQKVAQMCALIMLKYLNFFERLFDSWPHSTQQTAATIALECEQLFENDYTLPPEDNLKSVDLIGGYFSPSTRQLAVVYQITTEAGETTSLVMALPNLDSEAFKVIPNPLAADGTPFPQDVDDWQQVF